LKHFNSTASEKTGYILHLIRTLKKFIDFEKVKQCSPWRWCNKHLNM